MRDPADRGTLDLVTGGMRIGYARVSTVDQNLELQRDALARAGCVQTYEEKASGKAKAGRPELANMMRALRKGDTLIVWRLDRLGRSLVDLVQIVDELGARGVAFESLSEKIDTRTAQGRMFFGFMAAMAQYQRDVISENTKAGLDAARARGRSGGRPAALDDKAIAEIRALRKSPDISMTSIANRFGVSKPTIYSALKRDEERKAAARSTKRAPKRQSKTQ
ncbi:recombinase family protein [Paraburkholderia bryophila]|uniref:DNA invertase Pin-like site-specific DNA recombinase n=1 Tax=Paraburkholderia bryophila TaxID=420952 RepID=A0A329B5V0_9BURK|nr:recombinase family protein [Paraburkholderia bryophila]RAS16051.1 DNA invertase Pin-like site-specific DNA recombinase [Paraburkholderia bryophila]